MPDEIPTPEASPAPPAPLIEPPKPGTDFKTGDLVRLKSGGPIMTLGTVIHTHTPNSQVQCRWFQGVGNADGWFYLGQLETVSPEDAKTQLDREAKERSEASDKAHELAKINAESNRLKMEALSKNPNLKI